MAAGRLGFLGSEIFIVRLAVTQNLNPELNIFCLVFSPPTGRGLYWDNIIIVVIIAVKFFDE